MISKKIVCFLIICQLKIIWCKPWAQYGLNQSLNSTGNANWQNSHYRDGNSYGLDSMATTYKPLYPTLQPNYQPNMGPWNNNNNYPQSSYDNDGQRSVIPAAYPLQPNVHSNNPNNDHQATLPPFKYNGPYNNTGAVYNTRHQITPTRPTTVPFAGPVAGPYNHTLPTNRPTSNYNNYYNNHDDRYNNGEVHPNSQFNNTRNNNPQYPYQGGLNANRNGTANMYNSRPQPYDNRPGQPYNQNSNVQRPIDPAYLGNGNIGQSTYNTPTNNNNGRLHPNNGQSNYNINGQSSYNGPSNYNPFNNHNNNNNNNGISNRNSFESSAPSNNNVKNNGPPVQPDYEPNGIALAPFPALPGNDRLFNQHNIYGRQQQTKYNPSSSYNTDTLNVPLAPFPIGPF